MIARLVLAVLYRMTRRVQRCTIMLTIAKIVRTILREPIRKLEHQNASRAQLATMQPSLAAVLLSTFVCLVVLASTTTRPTQIANRVARASFKIKKGSTDCKECNAGRQSKADRTQCDDCSAGRFRSNSNLKQACAACAIGKYCGTTGCESCNDVGSNDANAGATEPTQTYRNDCGGIVGDPLCQCESTKACVKCLSYSNRRMDVIAEAEYGSSQVPIDCGTYTFLSESYNECVLGSIAYAFTTVMTLVTDPVCEHYVTSGCRL